MNAPALSPRRPAMRYFGGKWKLAPWIIAHFAPHRIFLEPYGGGANVLLRKPRSQNEIYNDLDGQVVNLFRVLRDRAGDLFAALNLTPYSREEYEAAHVDSDDVIEKARRLLIRSQMAHGTNASGLDSKKGFRVDGARGRTHVAAEWAELPDALAAVAHRFQGVVIENRPALDLIEGYSIAHAMIYLDPPYVWETRSDKLKDGRPYHGYSHEMSDDDHVAMLDAAKSSSAMVVISGYDCPLYCEHLSDWERSSRPSTAHRNSARIETLWLNAAASHALRDSGPLFEAVK